MATQTYFNPQELEATARQYIPGEVLSGFMSLRTESGKVAENPIRELRKFHDVIASLVSLTYSGVRKVRRAGLDNSVADAAVNLIVDSGVEILHLLESRADQLRVAALGKLREERAADPQDEAIYQSYAARMWPLYERALGAGRSLSEILETITDRKDCRVLREGYPVWYYGKYGRKGYDYAVAEANKQIDRAEIRFMGDNERRSAATWGEVETGYPRLQAAFASALHAVASCRSHEPSRVPIARWQPEDGENVIWVE